MKKSFAFGAYPTMITPFRCDHTVDTDAVRALVAWYREKGCDGIFAVCQSSEMFYLTLEERVALAALVREEADKLAALDPTRKPLTVVASGHISDSFEDQVAECSAITATGVDALVLLSNRMDIANTSDAAWIADCEKLISRLPAGLPLGMYECPHPYKRLLSPAMLQYMVSTGRFAFIKDTCCDAARIAQRTALIAATPAPTDGYKPALFNANAQTLLDSLRTGASGYSGIMCNFHPELYAWLCRHYADRPEKAELVADFLSTAAFIECGLAYPCVAKYHLDRAGVAMTPYCRSNGQTAAKEYDRQCIDRMDFLAAHFCRLTEE